MYYQILSIAYRSRLLFRTEADYRQSLGVSFETVTNRRESDRDMRMYYDILNREALEYTDFTLHDIIARYVAASEFYLAVDWGDRTQMASRRRFCRMLFRLYATAGMELSADEIFKFKIKEADERLLKEFFPDGTNREPAVDIEFIILFAFGVIRPWNAENSRGRDIPDKETLEMLGRLRPLIATLMDDTPRLGSLDKPLVFSQWIDIIDKVTAEDELGWGVPIRAVASIFDITRACRSLTNAVRTREAGDELTGFYMPGIWIDDADGGSTRFWIFPENMLAAFCYRRNGNAWELLPYEMRILLAPSEDSPDRLMLMTPEGNLGCILSPDRPIDGAQIAEVNCEPKEMEGSDTMGTLTISETPGEIPAWLNWREWKRLPADDRLYREFRAVLTAVYDTANPHSAVFRNTLPEITDNVNCFAGRDQKYIYFHDARPRRFLIKEENPEHFIYEAEFGSRQEEKSLFELEVSEEQPLYAIPIHIKHKKLGRFNLNKFADMLDDAENIREGYIVHSPRTRHPLLMFPAYSGVISLDMAELAPLGVIRRNG